MSFVLSYFPIPSVALTCATDVRCPRFGLALHSFLGLLHWHMFFVRVPWYSGYVLIHSLSLFVCATSSPVRCSLLGT
ncbi:hypothetical protein BKA62DRAFT_701140 [Auriculariales sp. MPI-PUGE-AT-0066]|nr:hypothetical protein BKA62DRAFT_727422 [Auriculariales sp. MPI-PUGE-AT-0066]KAH7101048.1 hypothetical protein BKA62DRAFT_704910 [Auriculariales sp. MPI-PUGE-AT-0066]KAH7102019.1 hypothetical protein BKA62DRAFT_701140 [Auriculariales sp. MPI-PUGE-AT-0066]